MNILRKGLIVYHKNGNKKDNCPTNLMSVTHTEHSKLHRDLGRYACRIMRAKLRNMPKSIKIKNEKFLMNSKIYHMSIFKNKHIEAGKKSWITKTKMGQECPLVQWRKDNSVKYFQYMKEVWSRKGYKERLSNKISKSIKSLWNNEEYRKKMSEVHKGKIPWNKGKVLNHKIINIERLPIYIEMYDFEVEKYHNFALQAGIFVHNSVDFLQIMKRRGITDCDTLSLDRTDVPYTTFGSKVLEGLVEFPWVNIDNARVFESPQSPEEWFIKEAKTLERAGNKIIKPPKGSKDVIDAVCGSVYNAVEVGNKKARKFSVKIV